MRPVEGEREGAGEPALVIRPLASVIPSQALGDPDGWRSQFL